MNTSTAFLSLCLSRSSVHSPVWKLVKPCAYSGVIFADKPEVKVTRKEDYDGMETLICRVGGFYPKEIDITWTKDGEVWMQDVFHGLVSPNSDGTYYTWRSVTVDPKESERYKCHVEHDGLPNPVDVAWEEPGESIEEKVG
uniref:Ig-like domain-containing protein n=1 Tax=Anolis carolinensis TaxID=28377 RepID=L7N009_ANOCA